MFCELEAETKTDGNPEAQRALDFLWEKRLIAETLFGRFKSDMGLEHTRRRLPTNALEFRLVHVLLCLAAYALAAISQNLPKAANKITPNPQTPAIATS